MVHRNCKSNDNSKSKENRKRIRSSGKHIRGDRKCYGGNEFHTNVRGSQGEPTFSELYARHWIDITSFNENVWRSMHAPRLEKTNTVVKNASGICMKIHGKIWCEFEIRGSQSEGYAYVTPHN